MWGGKQRPSLSDRKFVGVDFGGTKILTGLVSENGRITGEPVRVLTGGNDDSEKIIHRLIDSIGDAAKRAGVSIEELGGIGLGVTGPLDVTRGLILACPQLPTLQFFPLKKTIQEHFECPVYMNNDANCLIYGEALFGSGIGKSNVVGFTLGTGLGCAVVLDHKIFMGATESAGEVWPSPYRDGSIEDLVSGAGVSRIYKQISGQEISSSEVAARAEKGEVRALETWDEFGKHLGAAIAWTVNLLDPDVVILGGSITNAFKFFSPSMEKQLRKHICPVPAGKTRVVCAKLGDNAGLIGAAALAITGEMNRTPKVSEGKS